MTIQFRSDVLVKPVPDGCCGSDRLIALAAWADDPDAVPAGRNDTLEGWGRVIRAMLSVRPAHTSPFEKGRMEVYVEAPGVVWWQWTRHRFMSFDTEDFGFNLESGRYKVLDGVFYRPPPDRPCLEPEGFKPLRPELATDAESHRLAESAILAGCHDAWKQYEWMTTRGVSREVARLVLPNWSLYCAGYVGGGPLTWLQFFARRRKGGDNRTFPQWEIERAAEQCEVIFAERWPLTYRAFIENGRVSP